MLHTRLLQAMFGFVLLFFSTQLFAAEPCVIFVHGMRQTADTYGDDIAAWNKARGYWKKTKVTEVDQYGNPIYTTFDLVKTVTRNYALSYYVIGHDGSIPYNAYHAADRIANQIIRAGKGYEDVGGNKCKTTSADGGTFIVIAHSMGGLSMDYILGNNTEDVDPHYKERFKLATRVVDAVFTLNTPHRGSQSADAICGNHSTKCNAMAEASTWAPMIDDCEDVTRWLGTTDPSKQLIANANAPARTIYVIGGYEGRSITDVCLAGENDGIVQYASSFACFGLPNREYNNTSGDTLGDRPVCGNKRKMFDARSDGYQYIRNIDASHENHNDMRDGNDRDERRAVQDGIWNCGTEKCKPGKVVRDNMSTAELLRQLINDWY